MRTRPPGPSSEVSAINSAIGAESAFSLQCKGFVRQYVPQIIRAVKDLPIDEVRERARARVAKRTCVGPGQVRPLARTFFCVAALCRAMRNQETAHSLSVRARAFTAAWSVKRNLCCVQ